MFLNSAQCRLTDRYCSKLIKFRSYAKMIVTLLSCTIYEGMNIFWCQLRLAPSPLEALLSLSFLLRIMFATVDCSIPNCCTIAFCCTPTSVKSNIEFFCCAESFLAPFVRAVYRFRVWMNNCFALIFMIFYCSNRLNKTLSHVLENVF